MVRFSFGISSPQSLFVHLLLELFAEVRHRLRQPPQRRARQNVPLHVHGWFAAWVVRVAGVTLSARMAALRAIARDRVSRKTIRTDVQQRELAEHQTPPVHCSRTTPAF